MTKVDTTPLTEMLDEWVVRYQLTDEEREVLFVLVDGTMSLRELAGMKGCAVVELRACATRAARKAGERDWPLAALRLCREALYLASFDKERRDEKNALPEEVDCDL